MRFPLFGRKPAAPPPPPPSPSATPGHDAFLHYLREHEAAEPLQRAQVAGRVLFDHVYGIAASPERGARIEDLLAILASAGGFSCIVAALDACARDGRSPQQAGMVEMKTGDGQVFWFGDLPNRFLLESEHALLSLALGAAQALGGAVSLDMVHQVMKRVAGTVGGPDFGVYDLPSPHAPGDLPQNYVRHLWPAVRKALDLYEVPPEQRPMAIGFALQRAIEGGKDVLDPGLAAQIVTQCAVPAAKLDPAAFA